MKDAKMASIAGEGNRKKTPSKIGGAGHQPWPKSAAFSNGGCVSCNRRQHRGSRRHRRIGWHQRRLERRLKAASQLAAACMQAGLLAGWLLAAVLTAACVACSWRSGLSEAMASAGLAGVAWLAAGSWLPAEKTKMKAAVAVNEENRR